MDLASTAIGVISGLLVGGTLTVVRQMYVRRDREEERAISIAEFRGAVKAELASVHSRLDKIETFIVDLPCTHCVSQPVAALPLARAKV